MKLLLDEMLSPDIAEQLRRRGYDVVAVQERRELWGTSDEDLLRVVAFRENRVIVTVDLQDFLPIHAQVLSEGAHHHGFLAASPERYGRAKDDIGLWCKVLELYLATLPQNASLEDSYEWL